MSLRSRIVVVSSLIVAVSIWLIAAAPPGYDLPGMVKDLQLTSQQLHEDIKHFQDSVKELSKLAKGRKDLAPLQQAASVEAKLPVEK